MNTNMKRRVFLKGSLAAGAVSVAVGAGLLTPQAVMASWNEAAFKAKSVDDAVNSAMGAKDAAASGDIKVKAPDIAENGAVVPITVSTSLAAESIAILASKNPSPLTSSFDLSNGATGFISTRIKMGKTGDVVAVVKAGGKLYKAHKAVKVTIGGCGG